MAKLEINWSLNFALIYTNMCSMARRGVQVPHPTCLFQKIVFAWVSIPMYSAVILLTVHHIIHFQGFCEVVQYSFLLIECLATYVQTT